jgi:hypothetical protein
MTKKMKSNQEHNNNLQHDKGIERYLCVGKIHHFSFQLAPKNHKDLIQEILGLICAYP